jgi:hypothetical protein
LRSVGGGGEADLDMRAITTEDDIVDLDELYAAEQAEKPTATRYASDQHQSHEPPAPAPTSTITRPEPRRGGLGQETDEEFDRWAAQSARRPDVAASSPTPPGTARLPRIARTRRAHPPSPVDSSGHSDGASLRSAAHRALRPHLPSQKLVRAGSVAALGLCLIAVAAVAINTSTSSTPGARPQPQAHTFDANASNAALQKLKLARLDSAHAPASRAAHHAVDAVRRTQHERSHAVNHRSAAAVAPTIAHASSSTVRSIASARTTTNSQAPTAPTPAPASYHPSSSTTTSGSSGRSNSPRTGPTARHPSSSVTPTGASGALGPIGSPNG